MTPEVDPQNANDEHYFEVTGTDDGRTGESMDAFIKDLEKSFEYPALATLNLEPDPIEEPDPAPELDPTDPDPEADPDPEEPEELEGGTETPGTVLVNGKEISLEDIQRLYEFDQHLRANPDVAERVQAAVKPAVPPATETTPPADQGLTPPEWMDLEDPQQKFMWDQHVATQTTLATLQQRDAAAEQQRINTQAVTDMDAALTVWKAAHPNFNEDQIVEVRKHAADMNIITSLMATTTPQQALVRAMDLAALDKPELRTLYLDPEQHKIKTRQQRSTERKGKLNALGGSTGSVPRTSTTPRPMTDREATAQFAKELEESFQNQ